MPAGQEGHARRRIWRGGDKAAGLPSVLPTSTRTPPSPRRVNAPAPSPRRTPRGACCPPPTPPMLDCSPPLQSACPVRSWQGCIGGGVRCRSRRRWGSSRYARRGRWCPGCCLRPVQSQEFGCQACDVEYPRHDAAEVLRWSTATSHQYNSRIKNNLSKYAPRLTWLLHSIMRWSPLPPPLAISPRLASRPTRPSLTLPTSYHAPYWSVSTPLSGGACTRPPPALPAPAPPPPPVPPRGVRARPTRPP